MRRSGVDALLRPPSCEKTEQFGDPGGGGGGDVRGSSRPSSTCLGYGRRCIRRGSSGGPGPSPADSRPACSRTARTPRHSPPGTWSCCAVGRTRTGAAMRRVSPTARTGRRGDGLDSDQAVRRSPSRGLDASGVHPRRWTQYPSRVHGGSCIGSAQTGTHGGGTGPGPGWRRARRRRPGRVVPGDRQHGRGRALLDQRRCKTCESVGLFHDRRIVVLRWVAACRLVSMGVCRARRRRVATRRSAAFGQGAVAVAGDVAVGGADPQA